MRQLNYIKAHTLEWLDVPPPSLPSDKAALVRPLIVSTCDMDGVVISGLAPFKGPLPVGHEGVGEIIDVGDAVARFRPGDRAIIPWKISCGECPKCLAGQTAHCRSVPREAAYSWGPTAREWGGFLADAIAVPWADHMLCPLPAAVDPIAAAGTSDNITDAWRAVGPPLRARPGGRVLIAGGGGPGSIGLLCAGLASALSAGEVVYLDWDEDRRALAAEHFGARTIDTSGGLPDDDLAGGFDVLVDASGNPDALRLVLACTAPDAIVTCTAGAIYAFGDIPFPVFSMYRRNVTFHTGWVHTRPLMEAPLGLIADGSFDPRVIETAVVDFDDAPRALAEPFTKLVIARQETRA
ncbi:MAG: alcohol dehydrogenase catalytic domain-containing protein [Acetobacteraceae bacterium]|nr:alcohol dehydrogenase catalytic domain-containing protein [Acetobacteraceae bacterium]